MSRSSASSSPITQLFRGVVSFGVMCLIVISVAGGTVYFYSYTYSDHIFPGVFISTIPVAGLTRTEARTQINDRVKEIEQSGFRVQFDGHNATLPLSHKNPPLTIHVDEAVEEAYHVGRSHTFIQNAFAQLNARLRQRHISPKIAIDETRLEQSLRQLFKEYLSSSQNARLVITQPQSSSSPFRVEVENERVGKDMDLPKTSVLFHQDWESISLTHPLVIPVISSEPTLTRTDLLPLVARVQTWMQNAPLTVMHDDMTAKISSQVVANLVDVTSTNNGVVLAIKEHVLQSALMDLLKNDIKSSKEGNLIVKDGVMQDFIAPVEGIMLNTTATVAVLIEQLDGRTTSTQIQLTHITPQIRGDGESMGIREVLGIGRSEFSGSPSNRRKNIALGAKRVHGSLIGPNEEFSLLKTLGVIDGEHGWLPELVIKGDKTTPEFGGGLCQIGTTSFRGALKSGLPITERRNHSYRVRYYEPAGTDATIYDPAPDFRFKNDTSHWILITTDIKGDSAIFTFWGTKDGRTIEQSAPRISRIVPPPPKKEIETLDLKPGVVKCTEVAHAGADASFDYTVTLPGHDPTNVTFNSHYRPWGAVCLIGVAQLSASSTTPETVTEPLIP